MVSYDPTDFNLSDWLGKWKTRKPAKTANAAKPTVQAADLILPPTITDEDLRQLKHLLLHYGALSNKQVARLMNVTKGEASKRVTKAVAAGLVSRTKVGKEVAITLH